MRRQLDLGCGSTLRAEEGFICYGVDIADVDLEEVREADLAIERIPYDSEEFDLVTAYDFMEHIPNFVYLPFAAGAVKRDSMIELWNEIYRVLKPGGEFYMVSPCYPDRSVFQDPTHVYVWTEETPHYFSGDYYGMHDHYGHTSRFELLDKRVNSNNHLEARFRAIKSLPPDASYELKYPVAI